MPATDTPGPAGGATRRLAAALLLAILFAASGCGRAPGPPPGGRRLVVVGVDGATWSIISPLMEQGRMPRLAGLYRAGSAGLLRSLEPMLPAALWTTVATGKSRGAHAIETAAERIPGRYAARPVTADRRRAPALWTIASARGLTVGVSGWALTFPAETLEGFVVAEGYEPEVTGDHGYLYPEGALGSGGGGGEALALSAGSAAIAALDGELKESFDRDLSLLSRGLALYRVYQPRLAFFRFASVDLASHRFWQYRETRYLDLAASRGRAVDPARATALSAALPGAYVFFDEWLGLLLEHLPEKSTLLILSDHGFRGVRMTDDLHADLNRLLERLGYLAFTRRDKPDWGKTRAFTLDDVGGMRRPIYLNVKGRDHDGIVEAEAAPAMAARLAGALRELKSHLGEPVFRNVTVGESPGPGEPDLTVVENLGIDPRGEVVVGRERVPVAALYRRYGEDFGTHDPDGILLAAGEGIAAGRTGWSAELYDVVPTALRLMGLPCASDMPGHPVESILAAPAPADDRLVPTYNDLPPAPGPVKRSSTLADAELDRLRALGHLR